MARLRLGYLAIAASASFLGIGCGDEGQVVGSGGLVGAAAAATPDAGPTGPADILPEGDAGVGDDAEEPVDHGGVGEGDACTTQASCGGQLSCVEGVCVPEVALTVTASWQQDIDLDLHLVQPDGEEVYYRNRETRAGARFTGDACIQGHCEPGTMRTESVYYGASAPGGTYRVFVVNYDGTSAASATLEVREQGGALRTWAVSVPGQRGGASSSIEFEIEGEEPGPTQTTPCSTGPRDGECLQVNACGGESVPGHCPGLPADVQCCVEPVQGACLENASYDTMPRPNVGLAEAPGDRGCPAGMVSAGTFCVDKYEASLVEVLPGGDERPWSPYFNPGGRRVRAVSIAGAVPQSNINGNQAGAACAEAGKRLCSNTEWLRACQGSSRRTYPYGNARQPGACNDSYRGHPAVDYFETNADWIWSELDNACINQQDGTVAATGAHPACVSEDGAFDMMGNLHEWTSDSSGTFRGGFFADTRRNGEGCLYRTGAHNSAHHDYSTGFRCCADFN